MAKFRADTMLGFGTPGFISPAKGSGARMSRYIPPRSRLVRMRGLGDVDSDFLDWGAGNPAGVYGPVTLPDSATVWTYTPSYSPSQQTTVPAAGGGTTTAPTSVLRDITSLLQAGQQAVAQQRIIDLNIARARQGLPPMDPRYFSPSAAVNFGLTPQASQILLIGGAALLALMLLKRK